MATHVRGFSGAMILSSAILAVGWNMTPRERVVVVERAAPTAVAPAPAPAPPRPSAAELRRRVAADARAALEGWRPTFLERCWAPSAARAAEPARIEVRFNFSFDGSGRMVGVGLTEQRRAYRADVAACLRGLGVRLAVPAPGVPVQVELPLTLP
jgi:hypothetical protein